MPEPDLSILNEDETITITEHIRKKRDRKALPADLPSVDVVHKLSEDDRK